MNVESLRLALAGLPVAHIRYFEALGSSNDEALAWISQDGADGCLVVADSQTNGRGRLGRKWVTQPGSSLAFSLILRPTPQEIERLAYFSPLGALAICEALEGLKLTPLIKWPNDVLLNRRKVAGILVEAAWLGSQLEGMVIGIGLNIAPDSVPPAAQLLFPATSIQEAAGFTVDRLEILRAIVANIFSWRARLFDPAFFAGWEKRLAFRGEWVKLQETAGQAGNMGELTGQVIGLDTGGNLLLKTQSGTTMAVSVGDVHLRPIDSSGPQAGS
jgi:BirA family biotin operon repressor/biotin-[acetyl-CoA-carboxylase] ligase